MHVSKTEKDTKAGTTLTLKLLSWQHTGLLSHATLPAAMGEQFTPTRVFELLTLSKAKLKKPNELTASRASFESA